MKKQQVDYAVRKALENFDRWNDVSGVVEVNSGYYSEISGVIEDAVHIGIQMALKGQISYDDDGNVAYGDVLVQNVVALMDPVDGKLYKRCKDCLASSQRFIWENPVAGGINWTVQGIDVAIENGFIPKYEIE